MEIRNKIIKTELVNWKTIKWFQNDGLKKLDADSMLKLKRSLVNNSFVMPFHVWENDGELYFLDGHHREKAMKELEATGFDNHLVKIPELLPANFIEAANHEEAAKLVLIYSSLYARITEDGLTEFFKENKLDLNVISTEINLPEIKLDRLILNDIPEEQLDDVPAPPQKPLSKLQDVFVLDGKHRVMCGDSTKKEDVEKLMDGKKAELCITSPPYWVGKEYENEKSMEDILNHIEKEVSCIIDVMVDDSRIVINTMAIGRTKFNEGKREVDMLLDKWQISFRKYDYYLRNIRIWQKEGGYIAFTPQQDMQDMHWEFLGTFYKKNRKQNPCKEAWVIQGLWDIQPQTKNVNHSAPFPIEIPLRYIFIYTLQNDLIYEPYLGSGSTLIACEQTNRICYGMEIDPIYIDVILKRYHNLHPDKKIECLTRKFDFKKLWKSE